MENRLIEYEPSAEEVLNLSLIHISKEAAEELFKYTTLPAVCGRVCPQESQCEMTCILGRKGEPIAIGKLERYAGDYALKNGVRLTKTAKNNGKKVAVVGSGPSGITCS